MLQLWRWRRGVDGGLRNRRAEGAGCPWPRGRREDIDQGWLCKEEGGGAVAAEVSEIRGCDAADLKRRGAEVGFAIYGARGRGGVDGRRGGGGGERVARGVRAGRTRLGKEEEGAGFPELFFGGGVEGRDYGLDVVGGGDGEVCVLWLFLLVMSGGRGGARRDVQLVVERDRFVAW
jgi:hypothetical protein